MDSGQLSMTAWSLSAIGYRHVDWQWSLTFFRASSSKLHGSTSPRDLAVLMLGIGRLQLRPLQVREDFTFLLA